MKNHLVGRSTPAVVRIALAIGVLIAALALSACGSSDDSTGGGGETTSGGGASAEVPGLAQAEADLASFQEASAKWSGPFKGPKMEAGKKIVYISYDQKNEQAEAWGSYLEDVASKINWDLTVLDGQGSTVGQQSALNQAISLKPDGIILGSMPESFTPYFERAQKAGIAVVGVNSGPEAGALPEYGIEWNVMQDPAEVATALTNWVIVKSGGKGRIILTTDPAYAIVKAKTKAMEEALKPCTECDLLESLQVPFETAESRVPSLVTGWVNKYGTGDPVYVLQPSDFFVDYQIPPLRSAGVQEGQFVLTGMDGTPPAYERIRAGDEYQEVTVPIPTELEAYQLIDQLNNIFNDVKPNGEPAPGFVVDQENVETNGGENNEFVPENDYARHYQELWETGKTSAK